MSDTLQIALQEIERLGHGKGSGFGYTCADIAKAALDKFALEKDQVMEVQSFYPVCRTDIYAQRS